MKGRRVGPDALILVGLLVLFAVLAYQIAARNGDSPEKGKPRRSSYSSQQGGWKAFYLLLQREKFDVRRFTKAPEKWPENAAVVIAGPEYINLGRGSEIWGGSEPDDALSWVDSGGTLILLMDEQNALIQKLKLHAQDYLSKDAPVPPAQPAALLTGVRGVFVPGEQRWRDVPKEAVTLLADKHPAAVVIPRGMGRIVAITEPTIADNTHLGEADNARFLVQLVAAYAGTGDDAGAILFDEFHQGYGDDSEERSLWRAIGPAGRLAALQLLAVALLAAYTAARRFGLPRPLPEPPRVSSEYVASLADLYRRARAGDAALENVYLSFWRDLCRAIAVPLDSDAAEVAPRAAAALGKGDRTTADRLLHLLETCEAKIAAGTKGGVPDADLLRLAREIEDMRKELDLGGHAD
jgi:hypothetical protein